MPLSIKKKIRILIVDDEPDIVDSLSSILDKFYLVDGYDNPVAAYENFKAGKYDLAIIDYLMPTIDGFALYQKMKKVDPEIKVLIMTAFEIFSSRTYIEAFGKLNPSLDKTFVFKKPFTRGEILSKVESVMNDGKLVSSSDK